MASIPLPALHSQVPQQPDPVEQYARLAQLKQMLQNQPLQQQVLQQQVQAGQQENQIRQMQLDQTQAVSDSYKAALKVDPQTGMPSLDTDMLQKSLASSGHGAAIPSIMEGVTKFQQTKMDLQKSAAELQEKQADMLGGAASAIKAAKYDPQLAHTMLDTLPQTPQLNQMRQMIDGNPQQFQQMVDAAVANSPNQQKFQNEKDVAKIRANTPEMQAMQDWMAKNPGKSPSDYQVYKKQLDVQEAVAKETDPRVLNARAALASREAATKQALSQGDPNLAAQLLVNGDATLSELKARGSTPDFIARTLFAARKLSGGAYNSQQADAQFSVAKSPANTAFFGSAKSLTDKGGTLDQLAEAGKQIPSNQLPVFNKIEDWEKAATGTGPVAKYAAVALGVADDYAKVMGGGQGSDSSRAQALQLIGASQSPEQRAAALAGIRGAVTSQTNSRIGSNKVMQRMYGDAQQQNTPRSSGDKAGFQVGQHVTLKGGKTVTIKAVHPDGSFDAE